jgi:hypothetical protein
MLAPDRRDGERACYTLFLSTLRADTPAPSGLLKSLDEALRSNPHYAYCRDLGQLDQPRLFRIRNNAYDTYIAAARQSGQRMGDVKPVALDARCDWSRRFSGSYLADELSSDDGRDTRNN